MTKMFFNYVLEGDVRVQSDHLGENEQSYAQGTWIYIPKNTEHTLATLTKTSLLEFWRRD